MEKEQGQPFDPSDCLMRAVADVICGITFGEGYDTTNPDLNKLLKLNSDITANVADAQLARMLDFFPLAKYMSFKAYDSFLAPFPQIHDIIRKFLKERKGNFDPAQPVRDLIAGLLHAKLEAEGESNEDRTALLTDDYFINTIEDVFAAGYETTSTTMKWVLAFLVNYPQYPKAIQRQLDEVIGDQTPSLEHRSRLPLIQATVMETLRVGNVAPLAVPHMVLADTTLVDTEFLKIP